MAKAGRGCLEGEVLRTQKAAYCFPRTDRERNDVQNFSVNEERQLLEMLREWQGDDDEYRIEISYSLKAWEVKLSMPEKGKWARGVGATFSNAWGDVSA
jgi:hypothetical protein